MKTCTIVIIVIIILIIIFVVVLFMNKNESILSEHMTSLQSCVNNKLPNGPWKLTCDGQYFSENGAVLNAECKNNQGTYTPTSIRLNTCMTDGCIIHNNNGQLQCGINNVLPTNQNNICKKNNIGGSWKETCINPQYIGENILKADCQTNNGNYVQSYINIGSCESSGCKIYNNDGKLQCVDSKCHFPKGSWKDTCKDDILNVTTGLLRAKCKSVNDSYQPSSININECSPQNCEIYNNNGQLRCGSHKNLVYPSCPYPKGSWSQSCTNDFYDAYNKVLYAKCPNYQGIFKPTRINVNTCVANGCNISNINGKLECEQSIAPPIIHPDSPLSPPIVY